MTAQLPTLPGMVDGILAGLGLAALATADHGCAHDWDEVDL